MSRLDTLRRRVAALRTRFAPQIDWMMGTIPGRCVMLFVRIDGRDRILALAGQAFVALVPLMIVVATVTSSVDGVAIGDYLVERFHLSGTTADAVNLLFQRPPGATGGFTVLSLLVLLWSVQSFSRSLQRAFESAWQIREEEGRKPFDGVLGTAIMIAVLVGIAWIGHVTGIRGSRPLLAGVLQLVILAPVWLVVSYFLLSRRRPLRQLVPGAVISAVVQLLLGWATALYVPVLIERQASRYGVIGVAFALVSWLVLVAGGIVVSAVLGAELGAELRGEAGNELGRDRGGEASGKLSGEV